MLQGFKEFLIASLELFELLQINRRNPLEFYTGLELGYNLPSRIQCCLLPLSCHFVVDSNDLNNRHQLRELVESLYKIHEIFQVCK